MRSAFVILFVLVCLSTGAAVQTGQPARATRVSGMVVESDAVPKPIARAVVTLASANPASKRSTLTDERGVFAFADVASGQYTVSATKAGYLTGSFGATQPGDAPVPVVVADEPVAADVALIRSASISGFVRTQNGAPLVGAPVTALRWSYQGGPFDRGVRALRAGKAIKTANSDSRGAYRLYDLPPGDYVVMIPERTLWSTDAAVPVTTSDDVERARQILSGNGRSELAASARPRPGAGYSRTFHPGTADVAQAATVRIAPGDDRAAIDIAVRPAETFAISGVISEAGTYSPDSPPRLSVTPVDRTVAGDRSASATVNPDGTFLIPRVFPGKYILNARGPSGPDGFRQWARLEVAVGDGDVKGLAVPLRPTVSVSGRVRLDTDAPLPASPARFSMLEAGNTLLSDTPGGASTTDGSFVIQGVTPSRYWLSATAPAGWTLKSIRGQGDVDYADTPMTVPENGSLPPLDVTFTKQTQSLTGTLQDSTGRPATSYTVVVFAADRIYWTVQTRRVAAARPATDGSFSFATLPAGDYLMAAVTSVEEQQWFNPDFLAGLVSNAIKISIADGAKIVQNIRIARQPK